jgi:hypothetical protein
MSKTQTGSKLLQRKLLKGHPSVIKDILDGIEVELPSIMCDMYGNYLCSAAFQACSVTQRKRMLEIATGHLREIATDRWGTHSLQALIGFICTSEEQDLLLYSLRDNIVELSRDANGVHTIQRSMTSFWAPFMAIIVQEVIHDIQAFAHNPHSLGILKKCISYCRSSPEQRQMLERLCHHALDLVQSPFGNYAVQHALEEWGREICQPLVQALRGHFVQLSIQKFSSNVVEQMLRRASPASRHRILEELWSSDQLAILMSTVYGHYVARRALQTAEPEQKMAFENAVMQGLSQVRSRRLRARWDRVLRGGGETTELLDGEASACRGR